MIEERRWMYHATLEPNLFEGYEVAQKLLEGWVKWPWEVVENKANKEIQKSVKEEVDVYMQEVTEIESLLEEVEEEKLGHITDTQKEKNHNKKQSGNAK